MVVRDSLCKEVSHEPNPLRTRDARRGLQSEIEWFAKKREQYIKKHYGLQDEALDRRAIGSLLRPSAPEHE
jgi:hypothetical protein